MNRSRIRIPLVPDTVRGRLLVATVLASLLLFAVVFGSTRIAATAFTRHAVFHDARRTLTSARAILDSQAAVLDSFVLSYTEWNEFYSQTLSPDPAFIAEEFDPWLRERSRADALLWMNDAGRVVVSFGAPEDVDALRDASAFASSHPAGVMLLPSGVAVASIRPIIGAPPQERSAGYLAVARRIDLKALGDALGVSAEHDPVSEQISGEGVLGAVPGFESAAAWMRGDAFETRATLSGIGGRPAGTLVLREPLRGDPVLSSVAFPLALSLVSLVAGLMLGIVLSRTIARPLTETLGMLRDEGLRAVQGLPRDEPPPLDPALPVEFRDLTRAVQELVDLLAEQQIELVRATDQALAAEQALRTVLDESAEAKMLVQGGVVEVANPATAACMGRPLGGIVKQPLAELLKEMDIATPDGSRLSPADLVEMAFESVVAVRCDSPSHGERWMEVRADATASPDAFVLSVRDITEQYRLEQLRTEILSLVSHDLRAPLTVLSGYVEMLERDPSSEQRARIVSSMRDATDRMRSLVGDLLDSVSAQQIFAPSVIELVDLGELAAQAAHAARVAFSRDPIVVVKGRPLAAGDPRRLRQALDNLIVNACKHTPPDATIRIVAEERDCRALIAVEDSGPGVQPEAREIVFERFSRLEEGSADGAGLGLYIVRLIAETHDGRAYLEDAPGGGARFVIDLPLAERPARIRSDQRGPDESSSA